MAKLETTTEEYKDEIIKHFQKTGLDNYLNIKVMSTPKAKKVMTITKASPSTEYLLKESDIINVILFEPAYELLQDRRHLFLDVMFSMISYDPEKLKTTISKEFSDGLVNIRKSKTVSDAQLLELAELVNIAVEKAIESLKSDEGISLSAALDALKGNQTEK